MVPQEILIIEGDDLRHRAERRHGLPGHGRRDEQLGGDEQQRERRRGRDEPAGCP
jgi:hypothetical protein